MDEDMMQRILGTIRSAIERAYAGDPSPVAINVDGVIVTMDSEGMGELREFVTVFVARGELSDDIKRLINDKLGPSKLANGV